MCSKLSDSMNKGLMLSIDAGRQQSFSQRFRLLNIKDEGSHASKQTYV